MENPIHQKLKSLLITLYSGEVPIKDLQQELAISLSRVENLEYAFNQFIDKTDWVQNTSDWQELGMHRADALKLRIEKLERENAELKAKLESMIKVKNFIEWGGL